MADWQSRLQAAVAQRDFDAMWREGLLGIFGDGDWRMIRGVSQRWRLLDHDLCFVVAECTLRKLRSFVERTIQTCTQPPEIKTPAALLRHLVRWCLKDLPPPPPPIDPTGTSEIPAPEGDPALLAALVMCVEAMKPELREALRLKVDGMAAERAAAAMKLSPAGAATRLYRARVELEECLKRRGFDVVEGGGDA